ncbi:transcriptional regulator family: Fungal Specific TF [Penicillium roqueforti]|nr:transcriptional regulator family: Fungal Specific TF [Penicillium roqueforti]KAI3119237.1 transcriptional regulator family: Fungal Specific TF [Penicillium roqueforti]
MAQDTTQASSLHSPPTPKSNQSSMIHESQSSTSAVNWLEGEISSLGSLGNIFKYEIEFRTCPIRNAVGSEPIVHKAQPMKRCIWLPLHDETKIIVEKYITEITFLHHVVHIPSVHTMVEELYCNLRESKPVKIGHVSLLLGILASTTSLWAERDMCNSIFSTVEEAVAQSTHWMRLASEMVDYSRYKHFESIEDIQAMIILIFVTANIVGITPQARHMVSTAISFGRELSLHRIDHPYNSHLDMPSPSSAKAEICRRVWWYLVATDWQMSQLSGSQKGTYSIDPRHMMTNKPCNANDEDIVDGMVGVGKPLTDPTSMSYCLQRIRLGEFCREITDCAPFGISDPGSPDYEHTKQIDGKICQFAESLPSFFSLDYRSDELPNTDPRRSPGIIIQRYIINFLLHAQRCRLHLPYLSRASKDPTYNYSRRACLEAARMVIRTERQLSLEVVPFATMRLRLPGLLYSVCVAIIVLLIDFSGSDHRQEQETEILEAFSILERAKEELPFAGRLLESLKTALRRHSASGSAVEENTITQSTAQGPGASSGLVCASPAPTSTAYPTGRSFDELLMDPALPTLDDLWQVFDENVDSGAVDWNSLFAESDTAFLSM